MISKPKGRPPGSVDRKQRKKRKDKPNLKHGRFCNSKKNTKKQNNKTKPSGNNNWTPSQTHVLYLKIFLENLNIETTLTRKQFAESLGINENTITNWYKNPEFKKWFDKQIKDKGFKQTLQDIKEHFGNIALGKTLMVTTVDGVERRQQVLPKDQIKAGELLLKLGGELVERSEVKSETKIKANIGKIPLLEDLEDDDIIGISDISKEESPSDSTEFKEYQ